MQPWSRQQTVFFLCLGLCALTLAACQRSPQAPTTPPVVAEVPPNDEAAVVQASFQAPATEPNAAEPERKTSFAETFPAEPEHQVVARYFHRTQRCPTCMKISGLIEEAVQTGFTEEFKNGQVRLEMVDYEDPKNADLVKAYNISDPMLVLIDVRNGAVRQSKLAPQVWALFMKKDAFLKYVQDEIRSCLEEPSDK